MSKLFFNHVTPAPVDPIFGLTTQFEADPRPNKVNLSVGLYRNDALETPVLTSVKTAEKYLWETEKSKDYLPISGNSTYLARIGMLIFGEFFWQKEQKRICGVQTPGGTGALRIGGEFLKQEVGERIAIPDPTWPNHKAIFTRAGMVVETYPYYAWKLHTLDFSRCFDFLKNLTPGSCVLMHPCCHNPTGVDFTFDQWKSLISLFRQNGLLPFFDFAYQGFGMSLEEDASAIRLFAQEGLELLVAYSCAKNFGLYSERAGALFILTGDQKTADAVTSKVKSVIRANYSNPPRHASSTVAHILSTPALRTQWEDEVNGMRQRILNLRKRFVETLCSKSNKRDFQFMASGKGMFCFTGFTADEVERMKTEFAIYMTSDGRINLVGLSDKNLEYVAEKICVLN